MLYISFFLFFIQYVCIFDQCHGHGYLADPPARSSAWLFDSRTYRMILHHAAIL